MGRQANSGASCWRPRHGAAVMKATGRTLVTLNHLTVPFTVAKQRIVEADSRDGMKAREDCTRHDTTRSRHSHQNPGVSPAAQQHTVTRAVRTALRPIEARRTLWRTSAMEGHQLPVNDATRREASADGGPNAGLMPHRQHVVRLEAVPYFRRGRRCVFVQLAQNAAALRN